ncbi:hypothetical protein Elgi_38150 [Paenibacillus elgii]|uniref:hypothetical protein n=1 Tax=Paenibacillus elgii TaxID=189691 RepID=UPI002D7D2294|nr:hypothetical protein Elgi_38150 [Paenibacillus elgii]
MELSNVFIVYKGDTPIKSKRGKLFHHAKQHAASSITQLVEDDVRKAICRNDFEDFDTYWVIRKQKDQEMRKLYSIKEFELKEIR